MKITKIFIKDKGAIHIEWLGGEGDKNEYKIVSDERPVPEFYDAFNALTKFVADVCELSVKQSEGATLKGINVFHKGDDVRYSFSAKIAFGLSCGDELNITSPNRKVGDIVIDDPNFKLPPGFVNAEFAGAIDTLIAQSKEYIKGKREQGTLNFEQPNQDEEKE